MHPWSPKSDPKVHPRTIKTKSTERFTAQERFIRSVRTPSFCDETIARAVPSPGDLEPRWHAPIRLRARERVHVMDVCVRRWTLRFRFHFNRLKTRVELNAKWNSHWPCWKKTIEPAQNSIENVMDLMFIMGIELVLMETIMVSTGVWWILLVGC